MAKYEYVDVNDRVQTVEASSADAAMAAAKNIGKSSGVRLVPVKPPKVGTSTDASNIGNGSLPDVPKAGDTAGDGIAGALPGISKLSAEQQAARDAAAPFAPRAGAIETELLGATRAKLAEQQKLLGKSAREAELQTEAGVTGYEDQLRTFREQMRQEQTSLQRSLDAVTSGQAAGTLAFADVRTRRLMRESLANQTDISIASEIAQGNLDGAMRQVENKLKIEYGDIEDNVALHQATIDSLLPFMTTEQAREAEARKNELGFYMSDLQQKKDLERMDYQAKLQRQLASYEASLIEQQTPTTIAGTPGTATENLDLWAQNVATLAGGASASSRANVLNGISQAFKTGGTEAGLRLMKSKWLDSRPNAEKTAYNASEDALQQSSRIDQFIQENPDFRINYGTKKLNDLAGFLGKQDPKVVDFLSLTNQYDSKLRVVDTGLSLTGFELQDSQKRFYSDRDTLESYIQKRNNINQSIVDKLSDAYNDGIGAGFFPAYSSSKPFIKNAQTGDMNLQSGGDFSSEYDSLVPSQPSGSSGLWSFLFGK